MGDDAAMSWLLPTPLLILAGAIALALALPRVGRPIGGARLVAEVFAVAVATIGAFAVAWGAYWWIEQRWQRCAPWPVRGVRPP